MYLARADPSMTYGTCSRASDLKIIYCDTKTTFSKGRINWTESDLNICISSFMMLSYVIIGNVTFIAVGFALWFDSSRTESSSYQSVFRCLKP
jgi:hypothetical protein